MSNYQNMPLDELRAHLGFWKKAYEDVKDHPIMGESTKDLIEEIEALIKEKEAQPVEQSELLTSIKQGDHFKVKGELDVRIDYVVEQGDNLPLVIISINDNQFTTTEIGAIRFLNEVRGKKVNG
jgi:preprotein translocase subunit YajC